MAWVSCNLGDLTVSPADLDVFYTNADYKISGTGNLNYTHIIMNIVPKTFFTSRANTFILGDATNGIKVNPASGNYWLELWHNNSRYMYLDLRLDWGNQNLIVAGYDDVTQKGTIYNLVRYNGFSGSPPYDNTYDGIQNFANSVNNSTIYEILKNINIPEYTWQSVPSISGKNGILSLAQIKEEYINEGESVSGASADHFTNLSTENRIDVLINDALPAPETGGTTVTVEYTIPSLSIGSYEYCKLVAKKNSIPEGLEDGDKIVDIDPSLTSVAVGGLDGSTRYYFVIFIEDEQGNTASSEPKSCETGKVVLMLDAENGYISPIISNYITRNDAGSPWTINSASASTYPNCLVKINRYGTSVYSSTIKINKYKARTMYVDIEGSGNNPGSTSSIRIGFFKKLPNNISSFFEEEYAYTSSIVVVLDTPYSTFERAIVPCRLDNISGDFYIAFWTGDVPITVIRKVWFDDSIREVEE